MAASNTNGKSRGFTLLELMIVISMILILVSVAIPLYSRSIRRAKEAVLYQDLFTMRSLISQYTIDKKKAPQSLEDLVRDGYLRQIPRDPIAGLPAWQIDQEDPMQPIDPQEPGISDVHSASNQTSTEGTAYSSW